MSRLALAKVPVPSVTATTATSAEWLQLPTETEIYILTDGQVVIADMPMELGSLVEELGSVAPCEILTGEIVSSKVGPESSAPAGRPSKRETQTPLSS